MPHRRLRNRSKRGVEIYARPAFKGEVGNQDLAAIGAR
jgi:hypothetical protein